MSVHLHNLRRAHARAPDKRHLVTLAVLLLAAALLLFARAAAGAEVGVRVDVAPPPLPVYEQPPLPAPDYLWVPGYWSWGPAGYFWVPGTWMLPPDPDLLWTPGYWSFADGAYLWTPGYWAPQVGFYGGIDYGFGYFGHGYEGGYWRDRQFWYNRTVNNIGKASVTNVYNRTVENVTVNNVSYSGGPGGVDARPTPQEQGAARQPRHAPTREQNAHVTAASENRELLASVNQGHPAVAATPQPNDYSGPGVMPAHTGAGSGAVRGAPAHGSREGSAPPRRLAEAPPQTAPPPTHEQPGPAERATPPPQHATPPAQSRAAPEIGPSERPQVGRPPQDATPPPPPAGQAPRAPEDHPPH